MFGFLKRWREHHQAGRSPDPVPDTNASPAEEDAPPVDDRPGKSWYGSSLDLHEGLEISDIGDDVTVPMPLGDAKDRR